LMELAKSNDIHIRLLYRPGHFVIHNNIIAKVLPLENANDEVKRKVQQAFIIGNERTPTQDVEFAISQLVEVAVRSLSTGMNDPYTAITCIDWLSAALSHLVSKPFPAHHRYDKEGNLRIVVEKPITFEGVTDAAFNQIRQYSEGSVDVNIRLLEGISLIIEQTKNEAYRDILLQHARMIKRESLKEASSRQDRKDMVARYERIKQQNE
jgi:uncharacterized membrane protein